MTGMRQLLLALGLLGTMAAAQYGPGGPMVIEIKFASPTIILAHGVIMAIVFTFFFPLGSILLRTLSGSATANIHGAWQTFFLMLALAGFGLGAYIATIQDQWKVSNGHPIIGTIVIGLLFFQPLGGMIHHRLFLKRGTPTAVGTGHKWAGRVVILLGVINGGLGLWLAGEGNDFIIGYSVVAGVMYLAWFAIAAWSETRKTSAVSKETHSS